MELFRNILRMCVLKDIVSGYTKAVDIVFIKANTAMSSLAERDLTEKSKQYYSDLAENEEEINGRKKSQIGNRNVKHSDLLVNRSDPDAVVFGRIFCTKQNVAGS